MRHVTYSLTTSVDGYITDPDGSLDWGAPDEELFRFATDEVRALGVHLLGRHLYEAMLYWDDTDRDPPLTDDELEFAALWNALPKVVFSTTLTEVHGRNTRLASGTVSEEIARLRAEGGEGNIGIGGATLAAAAAAEGLIDEYRIRVVPVRLGGGLSYWPRDERHEDLELLEARTFDCQVQFLHYRVMRDRS